MLIDSNMPLGWFDVNHSITSGAQNSVTWNEYGGIWNFQSSLLSSPTKVFAITATNGLTLTLGANATPPTIHLTTNSQDIEVESPGRYAFFTSKLGSYIAANAYYDGTNWQRYDTAQPVALWAVTTSVIGMYGAAAGANPVTMATRLTIDNTGLVDSAGCFRTTGTGTPGAGTGVEIGYSSVGYVQSYNRTGAVYAGLSLLGNPLILQPTAGGVSIGSSGAASPNSGAALLAFPQAVGPKISLYDAGSGNYFGLAVGAGEFIAVTAGAFTVRANTGAGGILGTINTSGDFYCTRFLYLRGGNLYLGPGDPLYLTNDSVNALHYCVNGTSGSHHFFRGGTNVYTACNASAFTVQSILAVKKDVAVLDDPLAIVMDDTLHGTVFTNQAGERRIGFVADYWDPVVPEVTSSGLDGKLGSMDYGAVSAITFEALKRYVHQTEARLAALERKSNDTA
jgi:hypothetical protein